METTTKGEQKFGPPILTHLVAESTHPKKNCFYFFFKDEKKKKLFKDRWYQFQKNFNFEGRKNKFSRMVKNKGYHFSKKISNFKKEKKKKNFFKGLQKSIKVSHLKRKFKS